MGEWWDFGAPLALALVGRLTAVTRRLEPITWKMLLKEFITSVCMAFLGRGAAEYLGAHSYESAALIVAAGWYGPEALDSPFVRNLFGGRKA